MKDGPKTWEHGKANEGWNREDGIIGVSGCHPFHGCELAFSLSEVSGGRVKLRKYRGLNSGGKEWQMVGSAGFYIQLTLLTLVRNLVAACGSQPSFGISRVPGPTGHR
jgi:hypothetical protein